MAVLSGDMAKRTDTDALFLLVSRLQGDRVAVMRQDTLSPTGFIADLDGKVLMLGAAAHRSFRVLVAERN